MLTEPDALEMTTIAAKSNKLMQQHAATYNDVSKRSEIEGASPHKLTEMLLTRALTEFDLARSALIDGDIEARGHSINKAVEIVTYLRTTLDMENGGVISDNLARLYLFVEHQLTSAHLEENTEYLNVSTEVISNLLESWKAIK